MKKIDKAIAGMIRAFHTYNDTILGAFLFIISLILFLKSFSISLMRDPVSVVDTPRFFPQLVFGVLIIVLLVKPTGLLGKKVHEKV